MDREVETVIHDKASDVHDKADALIIAHRVAKVTGHCFAIEGRFGWQACLRKPSLRHGKVIECDGNGRELIA